MKKYFVMKNKFITMTILLVFSGIAAGSDCSSCTIKSIGFGPNYESICNKACVFIAVEGNMTNRPSCATDTTWHYILDTSTDMGRQSLSMLLAAHVANKQITFGGAGACDLYSVGEDFRFGYFPF